MSYPARPYESCKIFKGRPRRNAFSKLIHRQYKSFPPGRFCEVEIKNTTGLIINPVPHNLVRRIRFWRTKISGTWFYMFVLDNKQNAFLRSICLWGNIHDSLGRADGPTQDTQDIRAHEPLFSKKLHVHTPNWSDSVAALHVTRVLCVFYVPHITRRIPMTHYSPKSSMCTHPTDPTPLLRFMSQYSYVHTHHTSNS